MARSRRSGGENLDRISTGREPAAAYVAAMGISQQLHLDLSVPSTDDFAVQTDRAVSLGATILHDRAVDVEDPLYVLSDPAAIRLHLRRTLDLSLTLPAKCSGSYRFELAPIRRSRRDHQIRKIDSSNAGAIAGDHLAEGLQVSTALA